MALGADGIDEGTEATQARVIPRYRRVVWKRWRLSLTKPDITWMRTLILKIKTCYQFWSCGVDRGGKEEELDDLLPLHLEDKDFINLM